MSFNTAYNTFVNFSQNWWTGISTDLPQLIKGKQVLNDQQNERVSLICESSKLAWIILGIIFVAAAIFSGPFGTIGFAVGALIAYDNYKISKNIQKFIEENSESREFLKDTFLASYAAKILSSYNLN